MPISKNEQDRNHAAYRENPIDQGTDRRVSDLEAYGKLDAIANALGAATSTTPTIYNVSAVTAGTEYSQVLPSNTKSFVLKSRGNAKVQLSYTSGQSGTSFLTIPAGAVYTDENFYTSLTVYFQANKNGETIEIIAFA